MRDDSRIIDVPPLKARFRVYDKLMVPVMFILRGFRSDSLQETHVWHPYRIDPKKINLAMAVENHGHDHSKFLQGKKQFLFHAPIVGGWRQFSVYQVSKIETPFYIGWIMYRTADDTLLEAYVHRLPIRENRIRMLDGNDQTWGYFFAVNAAGRQIALRKAGSGAIGDGTFTDVRLF